MASEPKRPQFCPWCGSPVPYEEHDHEPRFAALADQARARGTEPPPLPERVRDQLSGESFATACLGCHIVSHVIGHRAGT